MLESVARVRELREAGRCGSAGCTYDAGRRGVPRLYGADAPFDSEGGYVVVKLEVDELLIILRCVITMQFQVLCISRLPNHCFAMPQVDTNA